MTDTRLAIRILLVRVAVGSAFLSTSQASTFVISNPQSASQSGSQTNPGFGWSDIDIGESGSAIATAETYIGTSYGAFVASSGLSLNRAVDGAEISVPTVSTSVAQSGDVYVNATGSVSATTDIFSETEMTAQPFNPPPGAVPWIGLYAALTRGSEVLETPESSGYATTNIGASAQAGGLWVSVSGFAHEFIEDPIVATASPGLATIAGSGNSILGFAQVAPQFMRAAVVSESELGVAGSHAIAKVLATGAASAWGFYLPTGTVPQIGDVTLEGDVDGNDIDLLFAEIFSRSTVVGQNRWGMDITEPGASVITTDELEPGPDPRFDLDIDTWVNLDDVDYLVRDLLGTEYGDANLDGLVDGLDEAIMLPSLQGEDESAPGGWSDGDFNGDGWVSQEDYEIWEENQTGNQLSASTVPEPLSITIASFCAIGGCLLLRRRAGAVRRPLRNGTVPIRSEEHLS